MDLKNIENNVWNNIDININLIKNPINQNKQYLIYYAVINYNIDIIKKIINLDEKNLLLINKETFINITKLGKFSFILNLLQIINDDMKKYILEPSKIENNDWIVFYFLFYATFDNINELLKYSKFINYDYVIDGNYCLKIFLLKNYTNISEKSYDIFKQILLKTDLKKLSEDYNSIIIDGCLTGFNKEILDAILIVYKPSINIINKKQLTPLICAINIENNDLINYLLKNGADYNYLTYTNALIVSIIKNDNSTVNKLLSYKNLEVNNFDSNRWLPAHHIFNKSNINIENKKKIILKTDNLNMQNTNGNTPIHLMLLNDNWKYYIDILENKIIDIYCKNKINLIPIDYLLINLEKSNNINNYSSEIDSLLEIIASSFLSQTKQLIYKNKNMKKIAKTSEIHNLTLKCLKKETSECIGSIARKIEQLKISKLENNFENNDNIKFISGDKTDYNLFISRDVDAFIYLIYFLDKYKIGILPPVYLDQSDSLIIKSSNLEIKKIINFYVGISNKYTYLKNLSIIWHDIDNNVFPNNLSMIPSLNKQIIFLFVTIINPDVDHANCIIIDKENKRIVHFEPYGRVNKQNLKDFDNTCIKMFKKILPDFKYYSPNDYTPFNSFQMLSNEKNPFEVKTGDIGGFCLAWTLWFFELYLRNSKVDLSELVNKSISKIINSKYSIMEYIRSYANKLRRFHIKYLKKIKYPAEKIFNIHTTNDEKDYIYNAVNLHIKKYIYAEHISHGSNTV
jgi:hypothetical protein